MSHDDNSSDGETKTAIAAAAYAVSSIKDPHKMKKPDRGREHKAPRIKSHKEDTTNKLADTGRITKWFSIKDAKEEKSSSEEGTGKMKGPPTIKENVPEKGTSTKPSTKKSPTVRGKHLDETGGKRFEFEKQEPTVPKASFKTKTTTSQHSSASVWKESKMEKIKKRFEKANATILEWENKKKNKAKRKLEKKEGDLELKRARALAEYHHDITRIDKIAGGARAMAGERKRNEEAKLREKLEKNRSNGKAPKTCFGF